MLAIRTKSFNTALPGNFDDYDLKCGRDNRDPRPSSETTVVSYHVVLAKVACYKKILHSDGINERPPISKLKKAEETLNQIIAELPPVLSNTVKHLEPDPDTTSWFQRYLLTLHLRLERLFIRLTPYKEGRNQDWYNNSRVICLELAKDTIIDLQKPIPSLFKKNWYLSWHSFYHSMTQSVTIYQGQ